MRDDLEFARRVAQETKATFPRVLAHLSENDDWSDGCPNCITPWKCNGPHEPKAD
jgi:hypothetical protein